MNVKSVDQVGSRESLPNSCNSGSAAALACAASTISPGDVRQRKQRRPEEKR